MVVYPKNCPNETCDYLLIITNQQTLCIIDICLFSETKLDETFPNQEFKIHGCKVNRRDRNKHGGGVLYYVNENIPCKMVSVEGVPDD